MKKFIFTLLLCVAAVCGAQAQAPMKFDAIIAQYDGNDAKVKQAVETLQTHIPAITKKFGWVSGRESINIDGSGFITFVGGEKGDKKAEGQVFAYDPADDRINLGFNIEISKSDYSFDVTILFREDKSGAYIIFNTDEVINAVANVMPEVGYENAFLQANDILMQYPQIKLGMAVTAEAE